MLVDKDGTIIADPHNSDNNFKNINEAYDTNFNTAVSNMAFTTVKLNGEKQFTKTLLSEKTGWKFVAIIPEAEVLATTQKMILLVVAGCFFIVWLASFVSILISNKIANPIKKVTEAAAIADGNFDVMLSLQTTGEVGQLIEAFNRIGGTLLNYKNYIDEITSVLNEVASGKLNFELKQAYTGEFKKIQEALMNISKTLTMTISKIGEASEQVRSLARRSVEVAKNTTELINGTINAVKKGTEIAGVTAKSLEAIVEQFHF